MTRDVQARIRKRIRDRLDELRMTGRTLAKACGHGDAWISGLLDGRQNVSWDDFDRIAQTLNLSPSELVRYDDSELRELSPTEMRMLRHFQEWPASIKDRWVDVLDFLAVTSPDPDLAEAMLLLREAPVSFQRPIVRFLHKALRQANRPDSVRLIAGLESDSGAAVPDTMRQSQTRRTRRDTHDDDADPRRTR